MPGELDGMMDVEASMELDDGVDTMRPEEEYVINKMQSEAVLLESGMGRKSCSRKTMNRLV